MWSPLPNARRASTEIVTKLRAYRGLPIGLVTSLLVAGLVAVALSHWRIGAAFFGLSALIGALLRVVVPEPAIGVLAVRSKTFDVLFLLVLGLIFVTLVALPSR